MHKLIHTICYIVNHNFSDFNSSFSSRKMLQLSTPKTEYCITRLNQLNVILCFKMLFFKDGDSSPWTRTRVPILLDSDSSPSHLDSD